MSTILRIPVTDDVLQTLQAHADATRRDLEECAARALRAAVTQLPLRGRAVVVWGTDLDTIEHILGSGSVLNAQDLRQKVERLAGITYGNIRLDFSPGQLEEIQQRAERLSLTPEELIRRTVKKMEELFFTHLGMGAGV